MHTAPERWIDHNALSQPPALVAATLFVNPAIHFVPLLLSPTSTARDACTAQIACLLGVGTCILETCPPSACDHCLDLPRHSICTDSRKRAYNVQMNSRVHAFNGCNIPRLRCYCARLPEAGCEAYFWLLRYSRECILGQLPRRDSVIIDVTRTYR